MRRADALDAEALAGVAARLIADLPEAPVVVDVGCGRGGMSSAIAAELRSRGGGTLILVDATKELLAEAERVATAAAGGEVRVEALFADIAGGHLSELVPPADLVWGSAVVHHLPDQQAGVEILAGVLRSGGLLAIAEGGLHTQCLPWELGVGEPGLERRLLAARDDWFRQLRTAMAGVMPMPYGWSTALNRAGLSEVSSFGFLLDHPAPGSDAVRDYVVDRVAWLAAVADELVSEEDRNAVKRLLDPADTAYVGARDDLFLLGAQTVHYGWSR
jgi:SAM-dependent methyltransferase